MRTRAILMIVAVALLAGTAACAKILGIRDEPSRAFPHMAHAVEGVNCVQCHGSVLQGADDDELHLPTENSCLECHAEPHDEGPCFGCHTEANNRARVAERKAHLRFPHEPHIDRVHTNCVNCHSGITGPEQIIRAPMGACLGCHVHRDQFQVQRCEQCHVDLHENAGMPQTHIVHDENFLARHGVQASSANDVCAACHQESFCLRCHGRTVPALPSELNMNTPMSAGVHRANFFARHSNEAHMDPGLCTTCHSPTFCVDCHSRSSVRRSGPNGVSPHPAGWVSAGGGGNEHGRAALLDPVACASCHGGAGEQLCVACHRVGGVGGSPHGTNFNSRLSLTQQPCSMCHSLTGGP